MKKFQVRFLALLLAMLLPLTGLASGVEDFRKTNLEAGKVAKAQITFETNPVLSTLAGMEEDVIGDIAKALSITLLNKENLNGRVAIALGGEDILSFLFKAESSNLYVNVPELDNIIMLVPGAAAQANLAMNNMEFKTAFTFDSMMNPPSTGEAGMDAVIKSILAKAVVTDEVVNDDRFDTAAKTLVLHSTTEDVVALMQTDYFKNLVKSSESSGVNFAKAIEIYEKGAVVLDSTLKYYFAEDGSLVAAEGSVSIKADNEKIAEIEGKEFDAGTSQKEIELNGTMSYFKKTESIEKHTANITMSDSKNESFTLDIVADVDKDNYKFDATLGINSKGGEQPPLTLTGFNTWEGNSAKGQLVFAQKTSSGEQSLIIDTTQNLDSDAINSSYSISANVANQNLPLYSISANVANQNLPLGTVKVVESYLDSASVELDFSTEGAIDLSTIDQATQAELGKRLAMPAQVLLMSLMGKLPASAQRFFASLLGGSGQ